MVAKQQISVLNCLTGVRAKGGRESFYAKQKRKLSTKATDPCALGAGIPQDSHGNHHGQRDSENGQPKGIQSESLRTLRRLLSDSPAASTVIVVGSESSRTPHILQDLKKAQWQIVVTNVDADHIDAHYSCATFSRRIITEQMLDHLLNKGCRRIAMVGLGQRSFNDMVHQDAMAQYLLKYPYAEGACFEYQNRIDESFNAFYAMRDGFDAVLCPNAFVAVAFLHFCEEKGIVVPNDLLVACMKDHSIGRYCKPSLTSLAVDFFAIGEQSVIVWQYLQEEGNERFRMRIAIQGHVIERESTGTALGGGHKAWRTTGLWMENMKAVLFTRIRSFRR